jgi:hypothetical protein
MQADNHLSVHYISKCYHVTITLGLDKKQITERGSQPPYPPPPHITHAPYEILHNFTDIEVQSQYIGLKFTLQQETKSYSMKKCRKFRDFRAKILLIRVRL